MAQRSKQSRSNRQASALVPDEAPAAPPEPVVPAEPGTSLATGGWRAPEAPAEQPSAERPAVDPLEDVKARIEALDRDHEAAAIAAHERVNITRAGLLAEQRALEAQRQQQVDAATADRLAVAVERMHDHVTDEPDPATVALEQRVAAARAKAQPVLDKAQAVKVELEKFSEAYGPTLDQLGAVERDEWLRGLPVAGSEMQVSFALVRQLMEYARIARDRLAGAFRNIDRGTREVTSLLDQQPRMRADTFGAALVHELWELGLSNDSLLVSLQSQMSVLANAVEAINERKRQYAGAPETQVVVEYENRGRILDGLQEAAAMAKNGMDERTGRALPGQPDRHWDVFRRPQE